MIVMTKWFLEISSNVPLAWLEIILLTSGNKATWKMTVTAFYSYQI